MTAFVLLAIVLGVLAAVWSTRPLWWRTGADGRPSTTLAAVLTVFMFGIASGGYFALGSPAHLLPRTAAAPAASDGSPQDAERAKALQQIESMVDQLAERLKTRPDDAEGWQMLARSYAAIGRHAQAVDAFRKATQLRPDDAGLLADLAFAVAMTNNRNFDGEPVALVERALKLDPKNPKALALAGTVAFERKDYRLAVALWERLAQIESGDGQFAE
jgi:cytochrome c-type biogenesis protein CcmH